MTQAHLVNPKSNSQQSDLHRFDLVSLSHLKRCAQGSSPLVLHKEGFSSCVTWGPCQQFRISQALDGTTSNKGIAVLLLLLPLLTSLGQARI